MVYLRLMRVKHYIKNVLVFLALTCSGKLFWPGKFLQGCIGFAVFCAASSAIYIINDIRDLDQDRQHPTKRNRPIAAGQIPIKNAWIMVGSLAAAALVGNMLVFHLESTVLLILYLLLNWIYSSGLKNVPLVDVTILVAGFLIRVVYGAVITDIRVSNWLYLTIITLAYYFAFGKRRNELWQSIPEQETRKVLQHYSADFLDKNMHICLALALVFYALWCMDAGTTARYNGLPLVFTVPIVLLIMMKYSMEVEGNSDGDPAEVLLHDRVLLVLCVVYFVVMFTSLYIWGMPDERI